MSPQRAGGNDSLVWALAILAAAFDAEAVTQLLRPVLESLVHIVPGIDRARNRFSADSPVYGRRQQAPVGAIGDLGLGLRFTVEAWLSTNQPGRFGNGETDRDDSRDRVHHR